MERSPWAVKSFTNPNQKMCIDSVFFRVRPWLCICFLPWLSLTLVNFTYSDFQQYKYLSQLAFHVRIYFLLSALLF